MSSTAPPAWEIQGRLEIGKNIAGYVLLCNDNPMRNNMKSPDSAFVFAGSSRERAAAKNPLPRKLSFAAQRSFGLCVMTMIMFCWRARYTHNFSLNSSYFVKCRLNTKGGEEERLERGDYWICGPLPGGRSTVVLRRAMSVHGLPLQGSAQKSPRRFCKISYKFALFMMPW